MQMKSSKRDQSKADLIALFLAERKVKTAYLLSGGMIAFIADSIYQLGKTNLVNFRHEQSAGFAAEGATRVSGVPNVALATRGNCPPTRRDAAMATAGDRTLTDRAQEFPNFNERKES